MELVTRFTGLGHVEMEQARLAPAAQPCQPYLQRHN